MAFGEKSRVTYSEDHRKQAKAEQKPLVTIDIEARHLEQGNPYKTRGRHTAQGVLSAGGVLQHAINVLLKIASNGNVLLELEVPEALYGVDGAPEALAAFTRIRDHFGIHAQTWADAAIVIDFLQKLCPKESS